MRRGSAVMIGIILAIGALSNAYVIDYTYAELLAPGVGYTYPVAIDDSDVVAGYMNNGSADIAFTTVTGLTRWCRPAPPGRTLL